MTHFEVVVAFLTGIIAILGGLGASLRWIYHQGAAGARLISAVDLNTQATAKLTDAYGHFAEKTDGTLFDHERRITRLEDQVAAHSA